MSGENSVTGTAANVYQQPAVASVDEAIDRMETITAFIESNEQRKGQDGVACFTYLYTVITKRVRDGINSGLFEDARFLTELDITFANRYFNALRLAVIDPSKTPRSWDVLIERRSDPSIESIQFAVAGVNAHVNFDLALAVIDTCATLGTQPNDGTQHADYQKINQIFAEEMQSLREHYETNAAKDVDKKVSAVLNLISDWSVVAARDAAWEVAEHFATLRRFHVDEASVANRLDRLAALSGHLLLTPVC